MFILQHVFKYEIQNAKKNPKPVVGIVVADSSQIHRADKPVS